MSWPANRLMYQTFHSSKESISLRRERLFAAMWSQVATTPSMNRSIVCAEARYPTRSSPVLFEVGVQGDVVDDVVRLVEDLRLPAPNVGIPSPELPQATSSTFGSIRRIALAVSAASRPYSVAVFWPICHGPSISLPRHHSRMSCGSRTPWAIRRSD